MKILCIADEENKGLWDYFNAEKVKDIGLIISCGDLHSDYLQYLVTMTNVPLLYVRGNHDKNYDRKPPLGCTNIEDKIFDYKGLRILGMGGSMKYGVSPDMYTESEMAHRIKKLNSSIVIRNGFDILVTHAPAKGYGDLEDLPHQGFQCFNTLMDKWHPKYMLHGHVHQSYNANGFKREYDHPSGTKIINCYDNYILDFKDEDHPPRGKTGSTLYDLYTAMLDQSKKKY